jgi:hypothetical protein
MPERKRDVDTEARNRGLAKEEKEPREAGGAPPRRAAGRPSPAVPDPADEETPAAPEHLENPPQVDGPRERVNRNDQGRASSS